MKHTHVVPPYTTIRIFSLTQIPNVDGARQPKNKKLTDREKEIRELEDGFFEWVAKFGNNPHESLGKLLKDKSYKSSLVASVYENLIDHTKDLDSTCPQKDPEHLLFHQYRVACTGILFGVYLKVKLDE